MVGIFCGGLWVPSFIDDIREHAVWTIDRADDARPCNSATTARNPMVNALVLLKVEPKLITRVVDALVNLKHVSEVYSVSGRYDVVVVLRAPSNEAIAEVVTDELVNVEGLLSSETLLAFRAHSKHDLERMFDMD
jgi:DNA-binding Lrp family transcriptional regulator